MMNIQDQICDEESLRSKYVRLGAEFKKLRERYRTMKDSFKESTERIANLESKLTDQTIHMRNLEYEKESLMFRNQYLAKQAAFLEKQLETANQKHGRPVTNGYSVDSQSYDDALKKALAEVHNLHEELVAQSSQFLTRIAELESSISPSKPRSVSITVQTSPLPNLSPFTQSSSSVDATSSSFDALCLQGAERDLLQTANNASSDLSSPLPIHNETLRSPPTQGPNGSISVDKTPRSTQMSPRTHSLPVCASPSADSINALSPRENILLERISQLESQMAEIALKQRLETRRTQLSQLATTNADSNGASLSPPIEIGSSAKEKLLVEYYEGQLHKRTKQLTLYAGRVADAYSEIRSLHEHLQCTRNESERQRRETSAAVARANSLEEELESIKHHAAQQLTEMAQHLANLTDDLQALRDSGGVSIASPATNSSACNAPKNSFFSSLLKRSNNATDFFLSTHRENSTATRKDSLYRNVLPLGHHRL